MMVSWAVSLLHAHYNFLAIYTTSRTHFCTHSALHPEKKNTISLILGLLTVTYSKCFFFQGEA